MCFLNVKYAILFSVILSESNLSKISFQIWGSLCQQLQRKNLSIGCLNVLKHREWLMGMKTRFIEQKNRLREITGAYRKEGIWIKPQNETERPSPPWPFSPIIYSTIGFQVSRVSSCISYSSSEKPLRSNLALRSPSLFWTANHAKDVI